MRSTSPSLSVMSESEPGLLSAFSRSIPTKYISVRTLNDEIPHGTAVSIEEFKDEGKIIKIRADIYCEKPSHKGIIIGKNGEALKTIGSYAREDLEKFFGVKVYLNLWVKVKEKWRDNLFNLNNFGYNQKEI